MAVKKFLVTLTSGNETWISYVKCQSRDDVKYHLTLVPERFKITKIEQEKDPFEEW